MTPTFRGSGGARLALSAAAVGALLAGTAAGAGGVAAPLATPPPITLAGLPTAVDDTAAAELLPDYDTELTGQLESAHAMETIEHLVEGIGPRVYGTPAELEAAEYLAEILTDLGFEAEIQEWGTAPTRRVAKVTSETPLPGNYDWQMTASTAGVFTGDDAPVSGAVTHVDLADVPADLSGRIAFVDDPGTSGRAAAVDALVAAGAVAVIIAPATGNSAPLTINISGASYDVPVLGGGAAHHRWLTQVLAEDALTLTITSHEYTDFRGVNVIGTRKAVGDPEGDTAPIVMIGGHIDSVVGSPGAHDDASGTATAWEVARVVSEYPTDKEIRIGGFGGEEFGLLGSRAYVETLSQEEIDRFVGEWQMDMVGTSYEPAAFWTLTPDGQPNLVTDAAMDAADRASYEGLQQCKLGQSDHVPFFNAGIPAALFIWLDYRAPEDCVTGRASYVTEPQYHRPDDTMDNVSPERMQVVLDIIGGSYLHNAMNAVDITVEGPEGPAAGVTVQAECGDGERELGVTGEDGVLSTVAPHVSCDLFATDGDLGGYAPGVDIHGDTQVTIDVVPSRYAGVDRVAGTDRYATAAVLALDAYADELAGHGSVPVTYVASGQDFPDALTVGALAARTNGPVLLTRTGSLPAATKAVLRELSPRRIVVLGGSASVSEGVAQELARLTPGRVTRIAGDDRYETAAKVAEHMLPGGAVFVASGATYPDALAASARAGTLGVPLLLTRGDRVPPATVEALERLRGAEIVLLGGEGAISGDVEDELAAYGPVTRIAGDDRYETAGLLAATYPGDDHVYMATGQGWADAVVGASVAGHERVPVLLTRTDRVPAATEAALRDYLPTSIDVLGGRSAVSEEVLEILRSTNWGW